MVIDLALRHFKVLDWSSLLLYILSVRVNYVCTPGSRTAQCTGANMNTGQIFFFSIAPFPLPFFSGLKLHTSVFVRSTSAHHCMALPFLPTGPVSVHPELQQEPSMFSSSLSLHKVHIYTEYQCVCSLVGIGTLPPHLSRQRVCPSPPPPVPKGGGHSRRGLRGWGSPNSDDWRKSL